jgi:predicted AlkP superfamily pyrophosphatase or phosphodiesterase
VKTILYFADGFSWEYVKERPFLRETWDDQRSLDTLLGYSSTIMPAILTGGWPRETGIWTEYYRDPRPPSSVQRLLSRPRLRSLQFPVNLARLVYFRIARRAGLGMEHRLRIPLALSNQFERHPLKYDAFPPIGLGVPTLADLFVQRGLRVQFRYVKADADKKRESEWLNHQLANADVFFFYDPTLDSWGHRLGASADALGGRIDALAQFIETAWLDARELDDDVELLLFSDHGMTTVTSTFDLFERLGSFELGTDYLVFMDSTMARFWFPDRSRRQKVLASLTEVPGRLLDSEQKHELGIDFTDNRYGDDVLVADEGVVFHPNYFAGPFLHFARKYPERAMHGYMPDAPSSRAVFMRRTTDQRRTHPEPVSVRDIFHVVEALTRPRASGEVEAVPE